MRGAQRSSLTNRGALLLRLRRGWEEPWRAQRLGGGSAGTQLTLASQKRQCQEASQLDGETKGGMLRSKTGSLGPRHPPVAPSWPGGAPHASGGEYLLRICNADLREQEYIHHDDGMGSREVWRGTPPHASGSVGLADGIPCSCSLLGAYPIIFGNAEIGNILWRARQEENQI